MIFKIRLKKFLFVDPNKKVEQINVRLYFYINVRLYFYRTISQLHYWDSHCLDSIEKLQHPVKGIELFLYTLQRGRTKKSKSYKIVLLLVQQDNKNRAMIPVVLSWFFSDLEEMITCSIEIPTKGTMKNLNFPQNCMESKL